MKITHLFTLLAFVLFFSCKSNNEAKEQEKIQQISDEQATDSLNGIQSMVENQSETSDLDLIRFFYNEEWTKSKLENYYIFLADSNQIISNDGIIAVYDYRDTLISQLDKNGVFERLFDRVGQGVFSWDSMWIVMLEFEKIGIHIVTAEGMYVGLERAPLLSYALENLATEDFKLSQQIKNAYGMTIGGEYPFLDLEWNDDVILAGEQLLSKFPASDYTSEVLGYFENALTPFVDLHKVISEDGSESFIVGGFEVESWPGLTDTAYHHQFLRSYPKSVFAPMISRIINNPSQMKADANLIYIVKVPYLEKEITWFNYFLNGIDIAHKLYIDENMPENPTLAYRFYDDKQKALNALNKILPLVPKAEIIQYKLN